MVKFWFVEKRFSDSLLAALTKLVAAAKLNCSQETISDSAECYAGLLVHFESSPACI